jgi:hypothetical protein
MLSSQSIAPPRTVVFTSEFSLFNSDRATRTDDHTECNHSFDAKPIGADFFAPEKGAPGSAATALNPATSLAALHAVNTAKG